MEFKGTGKQWDSVEIDISDYKQLTVICKEPKNVIAHLYLPDYEITDEYKANAKLIACAPEMLEMLEESIEEICKIKNHYKDIGHCGKYIHNCEELIKKATTI